MSKRVYEVGDGLAIVVYDRRCLSRCLCVFFFFQAEDGIRDYKVTGVQTCALPISVAVLGDEDSGVGRLGGYALGLERPAAGSARLFDTVVADLPEPERLAFRRRGDRKSVV